MCLFYALCTSCVYVCSCLCALRPHKHLTHFGLHLLIPVGQWRNAWKHIVAMTGGGFLGGAQMGFHMGFPDAALSGRHAVPRRILTPMLLLRLTWSEAQKVVVVADYYAARPGGGGLWKLYYMVNVCRQLNIWSLHPYVIPEHLIQKTWATICCYNSTSPHVCR